MRKPLLQDPLLASAPRVEGHVVLPPCVLTRRLGQGGMGAVYRAHHLRLDIEVAIKCLDHELAFGGEAMIRRFREEAKLAAAISHQNLVRVFDVGEESGLHYLIMELISGPTLREWVHDRGPCELAEAAALIKASAEGLAAAHRNSVVHRDIKPDNIMIAEDGVVKVVDLGLAKAVAGGLKRDTMTQQVMGTPRYIPPEQWQAASEVGPEGDVWALGACLWFLLAGRDPVQAEDLHAAMFQIVTHGLPSLLEVRQDLPEAALAILEKATAHDPKDRYENAGAFAEAIGTLAATRVPPPSRGGSDDTPRTHLPRATLERIREQVLSSGPQSLPEVETSETWALGENQVAATDIPKTHIAPERGGFGGVRMIGIILVLAAGLVAWRWPELWKSAEAPSIQEPQVDPPTKSKEAPKPVIALPKISEALTRVGKNLQGYEEYSTRRDPTVIMIRIPAASFPMGSDRDHANERPLHVVRLSEYYISKCEITNAQYARFCKETGTARPPEPRGALRGSFDRHPNQPVFSISWDEARAYCQWLGTAGSSHFGDLPTEAQWEYAARGQRGGRYPWGDTPPNSRLARSGQPLEAGPVAVGSSYLGAGPFGTFEQAGNVAEWCLDWFGRYPKGEVKDPLGAATGPGRVLRGGAFYDLLQSKDSLRCTARGYSLANNRNSLWGFRARMSPR